MQSTAPPASVSLVRGGARIGWVLTLRSRLRSRFATRSCPRRRCRGSRLPRRPIRRCLPFRRRALCGLRPARLIISRPAATMAPPRPDHVTATRGKITSAPRVPSSSYAAPVPTIVADLPMAAPPGSEKRYVVDVELSSSRCPAGRSPRTGSARAFREGARVDADSRINGVAGVDPVPEHRRPVDLRSEGAGRGVQFLVSS